MPGRRLTRLTSLSDHMQNVGGLERVASLAGGGLLLIKGFRRGGIGGVVSAVFGAMALYRGYTGHCAAKQALSHSEFERGLIRDYQWKNAKTESCCIVINCPRADIYRFWRDFNNLPAFMGNVQRIDVLDDKRSHWVIQGPTGSLQWDSIITEDEPNQLIGWRSVAGGDLNSMGWVSFSDAANGGTEVETLIAYDPPGGVAGHALATLMGRNPASQVSRHLEQLKALLENAGRATETATVTGNDSLVSPPAAV
ncbi:putative membrane protein [Pseudomonas duriflava]|uniref:Putative membrane protein n=1 Tax=Pseudomonas duriflava TaxID=459528 RepID=A0A562QC35_9PSED|nr:SRPBCC family protein [Pseudomonas duriflava]TWI53740.1 putative membrane protein [Pseudomonas duriflava]